MAEETTMPPPLIALIHGVPAAIDPAVQAIRAEIPDARIWNLLDDRLIEEAQRHEAVTPPLRDRMVRLIDHALLEGADGILITCSLYSFVASIPGADRSAPVLGADSAAFHDVIRAAPGRVILVASVASALEDSSSRLEETAAEHHARLDIVPVHVEGAAGAASSGQYGVVAELIAAALRATICDGDVVLFAQYSLSPAADAVSSALNVPVFTGPARAARELRAAIEHPDHRRHQFYAD